MKKKKNKTIAIFSGYATPHMGGVERYTQNLSQELTKNNYDVVIISSDYDFSTDYIKKEDNITYIKIPVYKLFVSRYPIPKKNKVYQELIKKLDDFDISTIIVNTRFYLTSLIGAKYGKRKAIPVYLVEHGSQHLTVDNKILDFFGEIYEHFLTNVIKKYVDYYYGVSKEACNWQRHFKIKSNGIWYNSISDFSKKIKKQKEKDGKINIVYAGRVIKQKGVIELLDSFKKIEKKYSDVYLTIAGDGNLLDYCKMNYSSKRIKFLGEIDFSKLIKIYSYTDIFVYAPIWPEGLPTSILEAGLMECAVIASPYGGTKEVIRNKENGLMITKEEELTKALDILISDKKLRNKYAKQLKEEIESNFLWEVTVKKIISDIKKSR